MTERCIYADDFLDLFYIASAGQDKLFVQVVEQVVEDTPDADVMEIQHGYWIYDEKEECYTCSICGMSALNDYKGQSVASKGCPHCLSKMDLPIEFK